MASLYLFVCAEVILVWPLLCGCADVKVNLTKSMLEFKKNGLRDVSSAIEKAFDGQVGTMYADCPQSAVSQPTVWLEIDLGQLYSLTKIALLFRLLYGRGARVYVGQTAVSSDGTTDYRCGSNVTIGGSPPLTDFDCNPTDWVRYVSIRRNGYDDYQGKQYLTVCEVEAYYDANEDPGVSLTRNGIEITALNFTEGDIVKCGSSKGDFGVTWMFPNGTAISNQPTSPSIRQAINSMGYQDLVLSPLTSVPPDGQYTCEYTANGMKKTKSLQLNYYDVDCQLGVWSSCSSSCGRGKRTRTIIQAKRGKGKDCTGPYSEDCANVSCGLLGLIAIKATATQGPGMLNTFGPSYAIDGDPLYSSDSICATPGKSTNPWLRIDLQSRYTIREVQVQFFGKNVPGHVTVNIGNSLVNNGTNNTQCGSPLPRGSVASPFNSFVCSPSLWGRYVILQKTFSSGGTGYMQVCDVQVYHELDVIIVYDNSSVVSGMVFADSAMKLPYPVTCGVNPDPTGLNALLNVEWKTGDNQAIPLLSSNPKADVVQTEVNNQTSLEIKEAPLIDTKYVCHYTWIIDKSNKSLEFDILINVDCGWSNWSSCSGLCGVGSRIRTPDNPVKKRAGKDCVGMAEEECDTKQPPCAPVPVQSYVTAIEGTQPALQCNASQYHTLNTNITFQWFKVVNKIETAVNPSLGTLSEEYLGNGTYVGSFNFTSVGKKDTGEYTCKATGAHSQSNFSIKTISLNVTHIPYNVTVVQIGNSEMLKGTDVEFECQSDSNPVPHKYSWIKDGIAVDNEKSTLSLSLDFGQSGIYVCNASNSVGQNSSSGFTILVVAPPEKCLVSSTVDEVVRLSPNCFNGNSPITEYKVRYRKIGETVGSQNNSYGISIPINVTGLSPYTDYELEVTAGNKYGYGEFSDVVTAKTSVGYPSAPLNVTASSTGPVSITVAWLPPIHPNGPVNNFVIFYKTVSAKKADGSMTENAKGSDTSFNLTGLTPYSLYDIEVAALNVRTHDSKVLTGDRSQGAREQTSEAAPSAPVELLFLPDPPTAVSVSWNPPLNPNGIIRNYTLKYQLSDGTGNIIVLHLGTRTSQRLENLESSTYYNVSIQAVTVSPGPYATLPVIAQPRTPGPPYNLFVENKTSESLYLTWSIPKKPNGNILGYEIFYRRADQPSENIPATSSSPHPTTAFNLTKLNANTNYSVSLKAVNDAKDTSPKSQPAFVSSVTLRANPELPATPPGGVVDVSKGTITLKAPVVSASNGPISFVKVVVYTGNNHPDYVNSDKDIEGNEWHEAAYFTFDDYKQKVARKEFVVGSGDTTSDGANQYTNRKLVKDLQYSVYFVVYGEAEDGKLLVSSSRALTQTIVPPPEITTSGSSGPPIIIIAVVVVIVLLVIVGVIVGCIIVKRRHSAAEKHEYEPSSIGAGQMSLSAVKHVEEEYTDSAVDKAGSAGMSSPEITSESLSVTVYEGTTALLPCDATGDPLPAIQWYRGGKSLPGSDTRFHRLPNGSLQITAVRSSDSGSYRCAASNKFGTDEQSVELTVKPLEVGNRSSAWSGLDVDTPSGTPFSERRMRRVNSGMHSVVLDDFPEHVSTMHELNDMAFSKEFKVLGASSTGMKLSTDIAVANLEKNRYKNILTYDHARVVLKSLPGMESLKCDYIAAAYIDGYSKPNKYIASQGPTKLTSADMWRMIWGEDVRTIVMVTHLTEGNKIKCHRYWPENVGVAKQFEGLSVTVKKVDTFAEYDIKTIVVDLNEESRNIKLYHFTSWPDHGVPKFATSLLNFIRRVNRELPKDAGPILVHCSAGVGRTGTFIVIDQMLEKIAEGLPIDIFSAVTSLRTRRQDMVQAESQYIFIHDALLEAVLCGNTQIPVHSLRTTFAKLSRKDKKDRTGFERQYLVLQTAGPHFDKSLCKAGFQPSVSKKNRYREIVPLDTERVVLRLEEEEGAGDDAYVNTAAGANYINASYVNGYHRRDAFIVTQGPLKNTVDDFWKMVWEQNSFSIVNLTQLVEDGQEMCSRYWPESGFAQFGAYKVELLRETPSTDYTIRKIQLSKGSQIRTVCQFHFTQWAEKKCPKSAAHLLDMMMQVEKWQQVTRDKAITVHCNNGIGRSGVFCALTSLIDSMKVESVIDVFYKVKGLRIKRPSIVQNVDQYKFCYQALLDYTDRFDTYANFK